MLLKNNKQPPQKNIWTINENTQQAHKKYNSDWKKLTCEAILFLQFWPEQPPHILFSFVCNRIHSYNIITILDLTLSWPLSPKYLKKDRSQVFNGF